MTKDCCTKKTKWDLKIKSVHTKRQHLPLCPECRQAGNAVELITVKALVSISLQLVENKTYYFCSTSFCPIVYYSSDGTSSFTKFQIRERVYQKEPYTDDVYVCYCFKYTLGELRNLSHQARNMVLREITNAIKEKKCACNLRNPQGTCCLENIRTLLLNKM